MDKGTEILKVALEKLDNLSAEELIEIFNVANYRDPISIDFPDENCYQLWNDLIISDLSSFTSIATILASTDSLFDQFFSGETTQSDWKNLQDVICTPVEDCHPITRRAA